MKYTRLLTRFIIRIIPIALLLEALACGVKGPPLPPIDPTPQASEVKPKRKPRPSPSPSPEPEESSDGEESDVKNKGK